MKKQTVRIVIALAALLAIAAFARVPNNSKILVGDAYNGEVNTCEAVSMTILPDTVTAEGMDAEVENTGDTALSAAGASSFGLQIEMDGQWYWLEQHEQAEDSTEPATYPPNTTKGVSFQWGSTYSSLRPGHYRVVERLLVPGSANGDTFLLAGEFTLE